jgi:hydrogenase expression/formation protein HypC
MCLAIPGKIVNKNGQNGEVDFQGVIKKINLMLLPDAVEGDFVLVHAGFAIAKTTESDALETLAIFEAMEKTDGFPE